MSRLHALPLLLLAATAHAEPVFTGKVSLTGLYYTESDGKAMDDATRLASTAALGYGEVRALLEGNRLARDRLDLRLDFRLRFTGSPLTDGLANDPNPPDPSTTTVISARGYLGGPEYDIRQIYLTYRITDILALQLGRMYVQEADAIKIDGARLLRKFGAHWEGSVFAGGYPNPYSRSILSDYSSPCGAGVAGDVTSPAPGKTGVAGTFVVNSICQEMAPQLALAGGATAKYSFPSLWGNIGLVGSFFNGPGDGGPVQVLQNVTLLNRTADPKAPPVSILQQPNGQLDAPRIYLNWLNSWRPLDRLDLFANLVLDLYGSGGPQLTRLSALGTLRLLQNDRLTLRLGYSHLSSLAINLYLRNLLYNRLTGTTLRPAGAPDLSIVENNLTVLRTASDEVRATADFKIIRMLGTFVDGRFRYRGLLNGDSNPSVYDSAAYQNNTASLGGEASIGLRDGGTIADIRAALSYTFLANYRALNHIINFDIGRSFLKERLSVDFNYVFARTTDSGADPSNQACGDATNPFLLSCFGQRSGMTHEVGLTLVANPWSHLFLLADYRFNALLTDTQITGDIPTLLSHTILLRAEFRW